MTPELVVTENDILCLYALQYVLMTWHKLEEMWNVSAEATFWNVTQVH